MKKVRLRWILLVMLGLQALLGSAVPGAGQDAPIPARPEAAEPLTLSSVYETARLRSPRLAAADAMVLAAEARIPQAGAFPDPVFQVGVGNLELPGLSATMPASMAPMFSLAQGIPFPGKRGLREEIAGSSALAAAAASSEVWWQVRTEVSRAFYDLYAAERQLQVQSEAVRLLSEAQLIAEALYASGSGRQTDVLRASVAVARLDGEVHRLQAARLGAAARLNGLLDLPADWELPPVRLEGLPAMEIPLDTLRVWAYESRPFIQRARIEVDRADAGVALAGRDIWPDVSLAIQYAQRPTDEGRRHMGGAVLGFSIPVYAGSKQNRAKDEAAAERLAAVAELSDVKAQVDAQLGRVLAEIRRAHELLALYEVEILPQARATVESALSSYRSGAVDFLTLLDAEVALTRFEAEFTVLIAEYGFGIAELEATIGRPHPTSENLPWGNE